MLSVKTPGSSCGSCTTWPREGTWMSRSLILPKHLTKLTTACLWHNKEHRIVDSHLPYRTPSSSNSGWVQVTRSRSDHWSATGFSTGPSPLPDPYGDIGERVGGSFFSSFADDTSVSLVITAEEVPHLQQHLKTVYAWPTTNNMSFNEGKFEVLRHSKNYHIKETTRLYTEGGQEICAQPQVQCLSVHISEYCSFRHHTAETVKKAVNL